MAMVNAISGIRHENPKDYFEIYLLPLTVPFTKLGGVCDMLVLAQGTSKLTASVDDTLHEVGRGV